MKTHHTDQQIQAAVEWACDEITKTHPNAFGSLATDRRKNPSCWIGESVTRVEFLKLALARLPEPPPPVVDGKTKAVDWEAKYELEHSTQLMRTGQLQSARERAEKAEAELAMSEAAFSNYRRLILSSLNEAGAPTHHPDIGALACKPMTPQERIKSLTQLRSIAEAAEPEALIQPAEEIPWTEWHGGECPLDDNEVEEWQWKLRDETVQPACAENKGLFFPSGRKWNHIGNRLDIIAYRVLRWKKKPNPETFEAVSTLAQDQTELTLSLRDWFAGQVMPVVYSARDCLTYATGETIGQGVARNAYQLADAMIAAREAKP